MQRIAIRAVRVFFPLYNKIGFRNLSVVPCLLFLLGLERAFPTDTQMLCIFLAHSSASVPGAGWRSGSLRLCLLLHPHRRDGPVTATTLTDTAQQMSMISKAKTSKIEFHMTESWFISTSKCPQQFQSSKVLSHVSRSNSWTLAARTAWLTNK